MNHLNLKYFFILLLPIVVLTRCGSSSSSSSSPSTIAALPKATAAIGASSSVSREVNEFKNLINFRPGFLQSATTGTKFTQWSTVTWNNTHSGPLCNTGNLFKNMFKEAAQADKIMCYVGNMQTLGLFGSDVFSGSAVYYRVAYSEGGQSGAMRIKMLGNKNSDGSIRDFTMWFCEGDGQSSNGEYVSADFSNGARLVSTSTHSGNGSTGSQRTVVTGTTNSSGAWLTKVIDHHASFTSGSGGSAVSMGQVVSLTQYSLYGTLSAYFTGTYGGTSQSGRMLSYAQLINPGAMTTIAMGEGTAKASFTFGGTSVSEDIKAWDGDTRLEKTASSADYYAEVSAGALPSATTPAPGFQTGETWDCQPASSFTASTMTEANMTTVTSGCNTTYSFGEDGSWVNCSSTDY